MFIKQSILFTTQAGQYKSMKYKYTSHNDSFNSEVLPSVTAGDEHAYSVLLSFGN